MIILKINLEIINYISNLSELLIPLNLEYILKSMLILIKPKDNNYILYLEMAPAPAVLTLHKVWCYPIQFVTPAPRLPPVEYMADKDQTYVRFNGEKLLINTVYLQKLASSII